ncbi:MAG: FHA domain-containing serine/threonine-protein kinase [Xenococcaceae cyanobacterium MO_188.B19]|nr:FHA domain-containing serine/threonine-protein kinase [Xenococcaceae cyanobacterium MO_188.B19]
MVNLTLLEPQTNRPLQNWQFTEQSRIQIGRALNNDVVLKGYFQVSRKHLEIIQVEEQWQLVNYGTNGTLVNESFVQEKILEEGDLIRLAENGPLFRFELKVRLDNDSCDSTNSLSLDKTQCDHHNNPPNSVFCIHCGQPIVDEEKLIGSYQILKTLGKGGMGITYLVLDRKNAQQGKRSLSVLKEMKADMVRVSKARELFEREARILKSLNHPNIPKYYDFFVENDRKYLVMELIHGQNLENFTRQRGAINSTRVIKWMIQVCDVLDYLHNLEPSLVHRDIKPANLILRNLDGNLMLLDFGAVKELGTSLDTRIGVEGYSAPEQYSGKPCIQSDIYAVGSTMVFLLTGKTPMQYYRYKKNKYEIETEHIPDLSPELGAIIKKCCEPDPRDRYQSAKELKESLKSCL